MLKYESSPSLPDSSNPGFAANTPNLYVYGSNNPLVVKDPRGEAAPFIVQAVKDVALYATTRPPSDYTAGG